jgi:TolA-binding protein
MNQKVKIILYAVLLGGAIFFARHFYENYSIVMKNAPSREAPLEHAPSPDAPANEAVNHTGLMMRYGAGLFFTVVGLALMTAHELTQLVAHRAERFLFSDDGEAMRDPEYEQAEKLWVDGHPLEAIQLMREHLKKNPRHQYVSLRIAEIYEKDLGNYVAAALEYEEVLKHKLPPERWGWAAIHLANLYSGRMNKTAEAEALLHRIVQDYGETAAAKKARERLGIPEPSALTPASDASAEPPPDASPLPPGFRPKKG